MGKGGAWSIGFGKYEGKLSPENLLKNINIYSHEELKKLNDSTRFLADPFFVKEQDTIYVFFEHQKLAKNAVISLLTSVDGKNFSYKGQVLKEEFHLSYPQVFKYRGTYYMLPETKKSNHVLLYKSYNFPYDWRICDTLLKNIKLKDPSIYLSDSLNIMVASDNNLTLYMYEADSLFGDWKPHSKAIVSRGLESRAAGGFFVDEGKLILPVQNSTKGYGYGVSLYQYNFNKGNYTTQRLSHLFLKSQDTIEEFGNGMHHVHIQKIDGQYHYVLDGNIKLEGKGVWNFTGPFKWNWVDLMNWVNNL